MKLTALFCGPSMMSGIVVSLLAVLLLFAANLSYLLRSGLIYDAIFGKGTPLDLIQSSHDTVTAINQAVFGSPTLNKILFFGFWMMVGLFIYITITTLSSSLADTSDNIKSLQYINARKQLIEQHLLLRFAMRIGGLLALLISLWVMGRFLFPFCVLATRVGLSQLPQVIGFGYILLGFAVLVLLLHCLVIAARLIAAKPRVFE